MSKATPTDWTAADAAISKYKGYYTNGVSKTRGRTGASKLAVSVALIVIVVAAGAYIFLTGNSATPPISTTTGPPSVSLRTAVNQLLQNINGRNVDGAVTFYTPGSVVVWSGSTGGLVGQYRGPANIRLIYATSIGKTTTINANISNYAEKQLSPTRVNATFVIGMLANSTVMGNMNATINVSEEWNWGGGAWQISRENWSYQYFYASKLQNFGEATTFPQWAVMRAGGNPDLVSEKSFEWHAGPLLAVGVYAFLFGILFFLAVRLRPRNRGRVRQAERRTPSLAQRFLTDYSYPT
ncbi:MAG TPA: hypothetical protein VEO75_06010 [Nitrososphaerales archaeon]|nr:hypothetical protein [Nitrososphaerales archaeon]